MIDWNQSYSSGRDYRKMRPELLEEILKTAESKQVGKVLDIGSGTGELAVMLAEKGYGVAGIDLSSVAVEMATDRADKAGVSAKTDFQVLDISDSTQREKLGGQYELITCKLVLAFIEDKAEVLSWIKSHLAESGSFVLITPVLHPGIDYSPRVKNISINHKVLKQLLSKYFGYIHEQSEKTTDENIDLRVFILR
jgi:2-polyprenyl-3-methyl-5-hydroxy-6-metoxy-1,4-benzoquinol methylase